MRERTEFLRNAAGLQSVLVLIPFGNLPIGMFQTQINENTPFSSAWPYPNWYAESRNNLQSVPEIVGPAKTRIEQQRAAPLSCVGRNHLFVSVKHRFKQQIETRVRQPYKALAQVISECGGPRSGIVASVRNDGRARIPVRDELLGYHQADRKLRLNSRSSRATTKPRVSRGQKHAHPGRKSHLRVAASQCLVAVIENNIADSSAGRGFASTGHSCVNV